ncbi:glycosyl hydrolase family 18 protein [Prevotella sp. KH2C16]|uniref:glycosyl hydrolase family 18 protein n=1 Tax=Prevotella sp. KH2C16 TaxID=1855325 RepID=UPI0008ED1A6F|nr:glycosyl hydrolase family 18 protein [Prevotella sp. KH2C16]SFG51903.1 Glycosyl hydrolases family 18 [Prevotella sp. KH2C16]
MRHLKYFLFIILTALTFGACDNSVSDPTFADDEIPYIRMDWVGNLIYNLGDTIRFNAQVSPVDETTCRWLINGEQVAEGTQFEYIIKSADPFVLRLEAERNGIVNFRTANVSIIKPFVPKTYEHVVMGAASTAINVAQIKWDKITHLMIEGLIVGDESGTFAMPDAAALANLKSLVSNAHNNGVYVLIDVTGNISFPMGNGSYNDTFFNDVLIDKDKRAALISQLKSFVTTYGLDGINIYINNLNNDAGTLKDHNGLVDFFKELGETFPAEREAPYDHFFITASVPQAWNNYEFYFLGNCDRLDWVNLMLFGGTDLSPVPHAPDWQVSDNLGRFANAAGIPASKMLVGIGGFGVNYAIPAGVSPTWGTIDQYLSYPTYLDIVKNNPDAPSKSQIGNLFYVGVSGAENSVASKSTFVKNADGLGMFMWLLDYDASSPNSLLDAIDHQMNP